MNSNKRKGHIPWNKGVTGYKQPKISLALKGKYKGEKSGVWKGENITYGTKHEWVSRHRGKPSLCERCKTTEGYFQWANISGNYLRELDDYIRLCIKCHRKYDNHSQKLKEAWKRGAYENRTLQIRQTI
jgi:hypothetical protein